MRLIEIISQNSHRYFTLNEAQNMLPLIYRLTEESSKHVKYLMACINALPDKKSDRAVELQEQINDLIAKWQNKLERLGAKPKGLWLADFDHGNGYYCWKFPEVKILFKHGYQDGFTGRILLESNEETHENCPCPN
jgi:hypothetical protein